MSRGRASAALLLLVAGAAVSALLFGLRFRVESRPPETWEMPYGFKGLIVVAYERPSCPPLPVRDGRLIYMIPSTGQLCTSARFPQGAATDEYVWVKEDGLRLKLIVPDEVDQLSYEGSTKQLFVFVGNPQEQRDALDRIRPLRRGSPATSP